MLDNNLKNHISFSSCGEINLICESLLTQTPVKVFDYSRVYLDGSRMELSNHADHLEYVFMVHKETQNLYTPALVTEHDRFLLTTPWIQNMTGKVGEIFKKQLTIQHKKFNLGNEFCIINLHKKYMEVFHFYSNSHIAGLENYYLNNITYFEKFALYFVQVAQHLIKKAETELLIKPWRDPNSKTILLNELNTGLELDSFLNNSFEKPLPDDLLPKKFYFETKEVSGYLTPREIQCVVHLVNGQNNKQIASTLNLSLRTVETHLKNVRNKTNFNRRSQIMQFFLEQRLS